VADRYWVGGTASWDGTAGTKWATTSGGTGGASVPTKSDDVFFTNLSTGTCTIATGNTGAKSINCTGFTGTIAGSANMEVEGSVTLSSGMNYTHTGTFRFSGSGTWTLTTAGKTFSAVQVWDTATTLQLNGALNCGSRVVQTTAGTLDTQGYAVTCLRLASSGSAATSIILGASTVTISGATSIDFTGTNFTFDAGTSSITCTSNLGGATFSGGGKTFYDVTIAANSSGVTINGTNTFRNLTLSSPTTDAVRTFALSGDQSVTSTLTCSGSVPGRRPMLQSTAMGTTRTVTAGSLSSTDCDFRDITLAGAAAGSSPTRAGNLGGNSGITFPSAKTVYRVGTSTSWVGSSSWATSSNGTGNDNNFPLAQDTAVIDNGTALTGTLNNGVYNIGTLDCSSRTTGITLNFTPVCVFYGDFKLGSGVTVSGTGTLVFSKRGTQSLTSAGKTVTFAIEIDTLNTFELADAYSSSSTITVTRGTFDAVTYSVTCTRFISSNTNTRTVNMGSGLWTISGTGDVWDFLTETNLTLNKGTADILLSSNTTSSRTFSAGTGFLYNKLTIGGNTSTSTLTLQAGATFEEIASTKTVAHTILLQGTSTKTFKTWSVTGSAGNVVTLQSNSAGTQRTNSITNVTSGINYLAVRDIVIVEPDRFYVGANSTNNGNNVNVIFTAAPGAASNSNFFLMFA